MSQVSDLCFALMTDIIDVPVSLFSLSTVSLLYITKNEKRKED